MNTNNLSSEQKQRLVEYFKCKKDPQYFIEKYIKLSLAGGDKSVPLYDKQKEFIDFLNKEHYAIVLKSRQTGLSTIVQMFCAHVCTFYKNAVIGIISKSGAESSDFCRKTMSMMDTLPEWLRPKFKTRNVQSFILDNGCQFYASQINEGNPEGLFRSKALTILIIDEAAFISKLDEAYTGVAPTLFKSQKMARETGTPYGTIVISTPNKTVGKGKWYYNRWTEAISNNSIFKPFKLHWTMIDEFANDPTWYATQCRLLHNVKWKIDQELDMQFVASNDSFFPSDTIAKLNKCTKTPIEKLRLLKYDFWLFEKPQRDKFYLIGIDTASASGSDASAIVVYDFETFNQIGEFKDKLRVDTFCKVISLVDMIFPNNIIIPESNTYGNQVCEYLTNNENGRFYNIYQTKVKSNKLQSSKKSTSQRPKFMYGLSTGPFNRPLMIESLYVAIVEDPTIIRSERLALELIGLVDDGNGKIMAEEGEQDDLALASSFCSYVRTYDPPLGMSKVANSISSLDYIKDVANWNQEDGSISSIGDLIELKHLMSGTTEVESESKLNDIKRMNQLLSNVIKTNMTSIIKESGTTIDMLKMLDRKSEQT